MRANLTRSVGVYCLSVLPRGETRHGILPIAAAILILSLAVTPSGALAQLPVATDINDFFLPGTQPNTLTSSLFDAGSCNICHGNYNQAVEPYFRWQGTMMANAARDPLFYACLAIANQDATDSGDLCIRCHTPPAWLDGRSTPTDGSAIEQFDRESVQCDFCHRMVDPDYKPGISPAEDVNILAATPDVPSGFGAGQYVVDGVSARRGPFNDANSPHPWIYSPFHRTSNLCGTCHDVSNPVYTRDINDPDVYVLNSLGTPAPSFDQYDMFPIERTYSEWTQSSFAIGSGIYMNGRFGGNKQTVATCQDCHMPDASGKACIQASGVFRNDLPLHDFAGANAWVPDMIANLAPSLWPSDDVDPNALAAAKQRNIEMVQRAANINVQRVNGQLRVRVFNETGHKLPSGYPEGRRMWINVQYYDINDALITEYGAYDDMTAILITNDTKVYETKLGLDAAAAAVTGLPMGESFHFVLNNKIYKDNRIPPRGFMNAAFDYIQAKPVAADYADGQFWDDTTYVIPGAAAWAEVTLYYQTASREYIEFLWLENTTNHWGQTLYDQWLITGMSPPVAMTSQAVNLADYHIGDLDLDGDVDAGDFAVFTQCFTGAFTPTKINCADADLDADDDVDLGDFAQFTQNFTGSE